MSKDTHKNMLNHSQAKVSLYGRYLEKYLNIISRDGYTTDIHIYDLFCGDGIYEDGGEGSPIIALNSIQKCFQSTGGVMPNIKMTFNDINEKSISNLKKVLEEKEIPNNITIDIHNDDYLNLVPLVKSQVTNFSNEKAVIFIDPKGYKEIKIEQIRGLLSNKKCELLLFLPTRDMFRFANMVAKGEAVPAGHEPLDKFIQEVFPENIPFFESQLDFIEKVKIGLKNVLPDRFIDTFTLERANGQFFCLFFFTSHIKGFEKMLETKWELDEENGKGWKYERSGTLFSGVETFDLELKLKTFIKDGGKTNSDLYQFILNSSFLPKQATQILRDLQENAQLRVYNNDGSTARRKSFYLNYELYKKQPNKVYFEIA